MYVREGSILPLAMGDPSDNRYEGNRIECHLFLGRDFRGVASCEYEFDDGATMAYRRGVSSRVRIEASVRGGRLNLSAQMLVRRAGPCEIVFVLYDSFDGVRIDGKALPVRPFSWRLAGSLLTAWKSAARIFF